MHGVLAFTVPISFFIAPLSHAVLKIYANLCDDSHPETQASVICSHPFIHKEIDLYRIDN